jgi:hypothetical protein
MKSALCGRLRGHFAACAAGALAVMGGASTASAQIVWSGIINQTIPTSSNGLYLNVVQYAASGGESGWNTDGGDGATVPGWDVNPWGSSTLSFFSSLGGGYVRAPGTSSGVSNLAFGTVVDASSDFGGGPAQTSGSNPFTFNSSNNLVGFRFRDDVTNLTHYGWMRIEVAGTLAGQPRAIVEYAFESQAGVSIAAGVIPAPGAIALLGLTNLAGSRRRRD